VTKEIWKVHLFSTLNSSRKFFLYDACVFQVFYWDIVCTCKCCWMFMKKFVSFIPFSSIDILRCVCCSFQFVCGKTPITSRL
jgi:hypothetical protein